MIASLDIVIGQKSLLYMGLYGRSLYKGLDYIGYNRTNYLMLPCADPGGGGARGPCPPPPPHKILLPQIVRRGPRGPCPPPPYKILDPPMCYKHGNYVCRCTLGICYHYVIYRVGPNRSALYTSQRGDIHVLERVSNMPPAGSVRDENIMGIAA